ncbi:MAG: hypothetical protein WEB56_00490 [Roseovarius sp.]
MTKYNTSTTTPASKATAEARSYVFDHFCELMTRVLLALEEEDWAEGAGWDIAFGPSVSDADTAWKLVALQAETVRSVHPLSMSDLLLHRMAGLISRAVAAPSIAALESVRARAIHSIAQAPNQTAAPVRDLAEEAQISIEDMIERALSNGAHKSADMGLPLAA